MNISLLSMNLGDGALYSLIGFIIVLLVLALLVGVFYLSGFIFQSKTFNKPKVDHVAVTQEQPENSDDEELVAAITAAISCVLQSEAGGDSEPPEFVIKRIVRKK